MAIFESPLGGGLRGRIDGLSFYKRRGSDKTIVRKSGGHSKEKVRHDPDLDLFKREGSEFGGRSKMSKYLRWALTFQKPFADYNLAGPLNALMKPIQLQDTISEYGQRGVPFSAHAHLLKGFSLNRKHPFDSVVRYPVTGVLEKETLSARVGIPNLVPNINFIPPVSYPYYSLRVSLGLVSDVVYGTYGFSATHKWYDERHACCTDTDWFPLLQGSPAMEVALRYDAIPPDQHFTLILAVGIRYGVLKSADLIEEVPYAGSAKVLEAG